MTFNIIRMIGKLCSTLRGWGSRLRRSRKYVSAPGGLRPPEPPKKHFQNNFSGNKYVVLFSFSREKIKENTSDLEAKMDYSKILLNEKNFSECIDVLLEIFKADKEWKEGLAKKQLLLIFDHLGSDDELSKKGRRALTSLIFI